LPGQFEDELTGIVQNRFRDYDPATGRYLTPDPLGVQGGLNTYRYTRNPVDYIDPLGLSSCEASGVTPEDAMKGEEGPVGDDGPAFQNIELAGAAALARAPAPVPTPPTSTVPRVITGAAANDAVYAVERSLLSRVLPALGTASTFVTGMLYSPELGGGLEQVSAPDGTVYSKHGDERIWNAAGVDGSTWQTASPQEDMEYRAWLANGGDGSFEEWLVSGKPGKPKRSRLSKPINSHLAGDKHPVTGVPFNEDGFPEFDSLFDAQIPEELKGPEITDTAQFKDATRQLKEFLEANPEAKMNFTEEQLASIEKGSARLPELTWHHHEDTERLQLVDRWKHDKTGHSGGRSRSGGRPR